MFTPGFTTVLRNKLNFKLFYQNWLEFPQYFVEFQRYFMEIGCDLLNFERTFDLLCETANRNSTSKNWSRASGGKYLKFFDIISYPISCHSWRYYIISHILEIFGILYTVKISIFHIYIPHIFISPKMMEILYPVIYPTLGYYIRYRYEKIYIFPTTGIGQLYRAQ